MQGNFSGSLLHNEEQNVEVNSKEHIGKERRRLAGEWKVYWKESDGSRSSSIFLKPVPFCQLRQAATEGQVVIINASMYGAHALIFDASHQIQLVHFPMLILKQLSKIGW